eukprot:COSAG02_NODE_27520_length_607_cov_13.535433_1_plen_102_part_00
MCAVMSGYGPPTFAQSRGHMGDFPAAADAMDGVPPVSMEGRRVRRARDVFDPSTEWARPQYGGELDRRRVQRELEKLAAREGADFGDLGLDDGPRPNDLTL